MDDLVERVARAICYSDGCFCDCVDDCKSFNSEIHTARAAIRVMSEQTTKETRKLRKEIKELREMLVEFWSGFVLVCLIWLTLWWIYQSFKS